MDTATLEMQAPATRNGRASRSSALLLSAVLCVVLPIAFWLAIATLAVWFVYGGLPSVTFVAVLGGAMLIVLVPVWASLALTRRKS